MMTNETSARTLGFEELTPGLLTTNGLILGVGAPGSDPVFPEAHLRYFELNDSCFGQVLRAVAPDERFEILHEVGTEEYREVLNLLRYRHNAYANDANADSDLLGTLVDNPPVTPRSALLARAACDYDASRVVIDLPVLDALEWPEQSVTLPTWDWVLPSGLRTATDLKPVLMFWTLAIAQAFKFWTRNPDGSITRYVGHDGETGTAAILSTLVRLWGETALTPAALRDIDWDTAAVDHYFNSPPMAKERAAFLHEALSGTALEDIAEYLLTQAKSGSLGVAEAAVIARRLPLGYAPSDPYLKKAQLLVSAAAGFLSGRSNTVMTDLTAMADYQVPRVLRALGVLRYGEALAARIEAGELLPAGGPDEAAIRAATVRACEQLAAKYGVQAALVDSMLWSAQNIAGTARFHLTETTYY